MRLRSFRSVKFQLVTWPQRPSNSFSIISNCRAEKIPPESKFRLTEALDLLIDLAEATGKAEDAKIWKDEKAKWPGTSATKPEADNP
jgi:hypothetical protein